MVGGPGPGIRGVLPQPVTSSMQDQIHHLWGSVQNANVGLFVKKMENVWTATAEHETKGAALLSRSPERLPRLHAQNPILAPGLGDKKPLLWSPQLPHVEIN